MHGWHKKTTTTLLESEAGKKFLKGSSTPMHIDFEDVGFQLLFPMQLLLLINRYLAGFCSVRWCRDMSTPSHIGFGDAVFQLFFPIQWLLLINHHLTGFCSVRWCRDTFVLYLCNNSSSQEMRDVKTKCIAWREPPKSTGKDCFMYVCMAGESICKCMYKLCLALMQCLLL